MTLEQQPPEEADEPINGGVKKLELIRGYVLLFAGVGLLIYSFVAGVSNTPGALTLGGALIGFNPLFRATLAGPTGHHG